MQRYGNIDFAHLAKAGFLLGLGLFALGTGGEYIGHAMWGQLPAWENTLLYISAVIGLLTAFFSPWIFGVILPLTE
ncbi:DUF7860 family protein [Natrinema ejinorense]|uniref:Uncharacterized protein n=1 Tax=Natrinema ejinorense TaxID=373386 RepID=A0A2A5QTL4_9EURY|nr:hypothetical protein [Natrinema ejinorense]PCR90154.1 hypothetical protein CP557_06125 [Natrinema ejinorense]